MPRVGWGTPGNTASGALGKKGNLWGAFGGAWGLPLGEKAFGRGLAGKNLRKDSSSKLAEEVRGRKRTGGKGKVSTARRRASQGGKNVSLRTRTVLLDSEESSSGSEKEGEKIDGPKE